MISHVEQLNEDNDQEDYYLGTSKKRKSQSYPISYKILIFISLFFSLLSFYLLYLLYSKKHSSQFSSFLQLSESRFSVREYSQKPIESDKIEKILRVAQLSPTAANKQPQKIYIITKEEDKKKLTTITKYTFNAPMFFLVCADKNKAWKHRTEELYSTEIDGSIVTTNMILEAHDLGLGSVIVRSFKTEKLKQLFNIPENIVPIALLPMGYPKEGTKPSETHFERKDLKEMVEYL